MLIKKNKIKFRVISKNNQFRLRKKADGRVIIRVRTKSNLI